MILKKEQMTGDRSLTTTFINSLRRSKQSILNLEAKYEAAKRRTDNKRHVAMALAEAELDDALESSDVLTDAIKRARKIGDL